MITENEYKQLHKEATSIFFDANKGSDFADDLLGYDSDNINNSAEFNAQYGSMSFATALQKVRQIKADMPKLVAEFKKDDTDIADDLQLNSVYIRDRGTWFKSKGFPQTIIDMDETLWNLNTYTYNRAVEYLRANNEASSLQFSNQRAEMDRINANVNTFKTQFEADKASGKIAPFYEFTWDKVFGEKQVEQKTQTVQGIAQNVQQQQQFNAQLGQLRNEVLSQKTAEQEYASRKANMQKMILIGAGAVLLVVIVGVLIWKFK